jgi:hypothetical protein
MHSVSKLHVMNMIGVFSVGKVPLSMEEEAKATKDGAAPPDDRSMEELSTEARVDMEEYEKQDKDNEVVDWVYLHRHQLEQWYALISIISYHSYPHN